MNQLQSLSASKPADSNLKTILRGQYGGDIDPYVRNYSHRNDRMPLKRDTRVTLGRDAFELKSDSRLQVAPNSRRFIKPE